MRIIQNKAIGGISVRTKFINRNSSGVTVIPNNYLYSKTLVNGVNETDLISIPIPDGATFDFFNNPTLLEIIFKEIVSDTSVSSIINISFNN